MDYTIENDRLSCTVRDFGAELFSLRSRQDDLEYIWQGDPQYWSGRSPILFPIVGKLRDDLYTVDGKTYTLPMHGFAKLNLFSLVEHTADSVTLRLTPTADTMRAYPYDFALTTRYKLEGGSLKISRIVTNHSSEVMPFSIGEHTGYRVPLLAGERREDYRLVLAEPETARRFYVKNSLTERSAPYLDNEREIPLRADLFDEGALIFKELQSRSVTLMSKNHGHAVTVSFPDYRLLCLWGKPNAPFVCIEPWHGLASTAESPHDIFQKEGILTLGPGGTRAIHWEIQVR